MQLSRCLTYVEKNGEKVINFTKGERCTLTSVSPKGETNGKNKNVDDLPSEAFAHMDKHRGEN